MLCCGGGEEEAAGPPPSQYTTPLKPATTGGGNSYLSSHQNTSISFLCRIFLNWQLLYFCPRTLNMVVLVKKVIDSYKNVGIHFRRTIQKVIGKRWLY